MVGVGETYTIKTVEGAVFEIEIRSLSVWQRN